MSKLDVSKADTKIIREQGELTRKMAHKSDDRGVLVIFCEFQRAEGQFQLCVSMDTKD